MRITAAILIFLVFGSRAFAECELTRPGPFLNAKAGHRYKKELHEDRSEEHLVLPSGESISVTTYGCKDTWGWKISVETSKPPKKAADMKHAVKWFTTKATTAVSRKKRKEYELADVWKEVAQKLKDARIRKNKAAETASLCDRYSALKDKSNDCVATIDLIVSHEEKSYLVSVDFNDLEN